MSAEPATPPRGRKPWSICFVSLNNYAVLSGDPSIHHVGGAEVQQALVARELARRGYRVSFVVADHGQPEGDLPGGLRIIKAYGRGAGLPGLRFLSRVSRLWAALSRADADVYYQRCAGQETGLVALWCRRAGRRFAFGLASDYDCDLRHASRNRWDERVLYSYGLRHADVIIAQTEQQQRLLARNTGLSSVLVRSCAEPLAAELEADRDAGPGGRALWVGRFSPQKRPGWVADLARDLPEVAFTVVGQANRPSQAAAELERRFEALPNVTHRGFVPHREMVHLYTQAAVLLSTSEAEGFPNAFLEAWGVGTPVLTTLDPDGIVSRYELGEVAPDYASLQRRLAALPLERERWREYGEHGRRYVREQHGVEICVGRLEECLTATVASRR